MDGFVVESHVERAAFAEEPVVVTRLSDGRVVRRLGGTNARGGVTFVVPEHWTPVSPQGTWAAAALPVVLHVALPKSRDLGDAEDAEVDVAARTWGRVACTLFRATLGATTTVGPGDDGISGVYFEDTSWPSELTSGAIATTVVHVDAQSHIYDADIYVNGKDHTFSLDGRGSTVDFRSIATHEIGHVLGLGESNVPGATMYAAYPPGVAWRSLEQDDDDGACALYPGMGDGLGCEASPCPSGFACVARDCLRTGDQRMTCSPCEPLLLSSCEGAGDKARCFPFANGYACGRPCTEAGDCGLGFSCVATTEAGDFQCLSNDACQHGENTCVTKADCRDPSDLGWICPQGACVGPLPADAGADAGTEAGEDGSMTYVSKGGCTVGTVNSDGSWFAFVLGTLLRVRRKR